MLALLSYEERGQMDYDQERLDTLMEHIFMVSQPKSWMEWKSTRDRKRAEEGVDQVIYQGESEEAFREIARLGLDRPPMDPNVGDARR